MARTGKTQVKRPAFQQNAARFLRALGLTGGLIALAVSGAAAQSEHFETGPALWRIADEDTELYLFGTVHVMPEGLNWQREVIRDALETAEQVYFETSPDDPTSGSSLAFFKAGMAGPGESVHDVLSPEQFTQLSNALKEVGLNINTLKGQKPWLAALMLSVAMLQDTGHYAEFGAETWIQSQLDDTLTIKSLENGVTVANSLSAMPMQVQVDMLLEGLSPPEEGETDELTNINLALKAWLKGRPDRIFDLVSSEMKSETPVLYDVMFTSRNADWAGKLDAMMTRETGSIFIAVGAGHLTGPDSVLVMMSERGWGVERL